MVSPGYHVYPKITCHSIFHCYNGKVLFSIIIEKLLSLSATNTLKCRAVNKFFGTNMPFFGTGTVLVLKMILAKYSYNQRDSLWYNVLILKFFGKILGYLALLFLKYSQLLLFQSLFIFHLYKYVDYLSLGRLQHPSYYRL